MRNKTGLKNIPSNGKITAVRSIIKGTYLIEPPSSPLTIQFSLWLQTMDLIAWSWAWSIKGTTKISQAYTWAMDSLQGVKTNAIKYLKNHFKVKRLSIPKRKFATLWSGYKTPPCRGPLYPKKGLQSQWKNILFIRQRNQRHGISYLKAKAKMESI